MITTGSINNMCGPSAEQDPRSWSKKEKVLIREMEKNNEFSQIYNQKVDIDKISIVQMKPWIEKTIAELQGEEDDIAVAFCIGQLEAEQKKKDGAYMMEPKRFQLNVKGVLGNLAAPFCHALWDKLLQEQAKGGSKDQSAEEKRYEMKMKFKAEEARTSLEDLNEMLNNDFFGTAQVEDTPQPSQAHRSSRRSRDDDVRPNHREDDWRESERHRYGGSSTQRGSHSARVFREEDSSLRMVDVIGGREARGPGRGRERSRERRRHRDSGEHKQGRHVSRSDGRSRSRSFSPTRYMAKVRQGEESRFSDGPPVGQVTPQVPPPPSHFPETPDVPQLFQVGDVVTL